MKCVEHYVVRADTFYVYVDQDLGPQLGNFEDATKYDISIAGNMAKCQDLAQYMKSIYPNMVVSIEYVNITTVVTFVQEIL